MQFKQTAPNLHPHLAHGGQDQCSQMQFDVDVLAVQQSSLLSGLGTKLGDQPHMLAHQVKAKLTAPNVRVHIA